MKAVFIQAGDRKKKPPEGGFSDTARSSVNSRLLDGGSSSVSRCGCSIGGLVGGFRGCRSNTGGSASGCRCSVGRGCCGSCSGAGRSFLDGFNNRCRRGCWSWHFLFLATSGEGGGSNDGGQNVRLIHDSIDLETVDGTPARENRTDAGNRRISRNRPGRIVRRIGRFFRVNPRSMQINYKPR